MIPNLFTKLETRILANEYVTFTYVRFGLSYSLVNSAPQLSRGAARHTPRFYVRRPNCIRGYRRRRLTQPPLFALFVIL